MALIKRTLYIIRGLPGSGKSTMAAALQEHCNIVSQSCSWVEADDYFVGHDGKYTYDGSKIGEAHDWCQQEAAKAMQHDYEVVIVSNTSTRLWEMQPYLDMAKAYNYHVQVLHCEGQFGCTHDVPAATLSKMAARWERYRPSVEDLPAETGDTTSPAVADSLPSPDEVHELLHDALGG